MRSFLCLLMYCIILVILRCVLLKQCYLPWIGRISVILFLCMDCLILLVTILYLFSLRYSCIYTDICIFLPPTLIFGPRPLPPICFSRPWPQMLFPWFQNVCFPAPGLYSCLFICFSFVKCLSYFKEIVTFFCLCKIVYSWVPNNWGDNRRFGIFSIYY